MQSGNIEFGGNVVFVEIWKCFVQPLARTLQKVLGGRNHNFVVDFCLLDIDTPLLFFNDLLERGEVDVCVGVK